MIPARTLGAGPWWADSFGYVAAAIPSPTSLYVVKSGFIYRARDGWVVR